MPCIQVKTNVKTDAKAAENIKKALGQAISCFLGTREQWLLVSIQDDCTMFFGGQGEKAVAMVEVDILGSAIDKEGSVKITEMITKTLNENLGIAKDDMYIRYRASEDWGWNGTNF